MSDPENTGQPYLTGIGELYFVSRHTGAGATLGETDIYWRQVSAAGDVMPAVMSFGHVPELVDSFPVISTDGREAFFGRQTFGDGGAAGKYVIWTARRSTPSESWSTFEALPAVSGPKGNTYPTWISPDRRTLYLTWEGAGTGPAIARATRPK